MTRTATRGRTRQGRRSEPGAVDLRSLDVRALDLDELLALLPEIEAQAEQTRRDLSDCVEQLRARRASWQEIGDALQVSRQAAWQRFGPTVRRRPGADRS